MITNLIHIQRSEFSCSEMLHGPQAFASFWVGSWKWRPRCNGNCYSILGLLIGIMDNKLETTIVHWGFIGIMENRMETTIVHRGYIGIMEKKMETTGVILGSWTINWKLL